MENLVFGIVSIGTTVALGYLGWVKFKTEQYQTCLLIIIAIGLILRLFVGTDLFLHEWDERYHALVAMNMIDSPFFPKLYQDPILPYNYQHWGSNHIWVHKQPFPLWCMALSMKVFGVNEIALRIPTILLSTLCIYCTFLIARSFFGIKVALLATFIHAIHGLTIELTGGRVATDHIDVFYLGLIEISILFGLYHAKSRKLTYLVLMSVFCGLAILTKWLPALVVFPIWMTFWLKFQRNNFLGVVKYGLAALVFVLIVAAPWQIWITYQFPIEADWTSKLNVKRIFAGIDGHGQPFYYHFNKIRIIFGEFIYVPMIWILYIFYKKRRYSFLFLIIWIFVPLLFFSVVKTKMQAYLLFTAPAFFILTALFFRYLYFIHRKTSTPKLLMLLMVGLLLLPARYAVERIKPFSIRDRNPDWAIALRKFDQQLLPDEKYVLFNEDRPIEAMFYCQSLTAYPNLPDREKIQEIREAGYLVFVKKVSSDSIFYTSYPSSKEN